MTSPSNAGAGVFPGASSALFRYAAENVSGGLGRRSFTPMDAILYWNDVALEANRVSHTNGKGEQTGPP